MDAGKVFFSLCIDSHYDYTLKWIETRHISIYTAIKNAITYTVWNLKCRASENFIHQRTSGWIFVCFTLFESWVQHRCFLELLPQRQHYLKREISWTFLQLIITKPKRRPSQRNWNFDKTKKGLTKFTDTGLNWLPSVWS